MLDMCVRTLTVAAMNTLLQDIDQFLAEFPMSDGRFGMLAARDGRLMQRLRNGGRVWPEKEEEIRGYMASRRSSQDKAAAA